MRFVFGLLVALLSALVGCMSFDEVESRADSPEEPSEATDPQAFSLTLDGARAAGYAHAIHAFGPTTEFSTPNGAVSFTTLAPDGSDETPFGAPVVVPDGSLRRSYQSFAEHWANSGYDARQSFHFAASPGAALSLRLRVDGASHVSTDDAGVHFRSGSSGFRYSHATWISGDGRRTPVRVAFDSDALVLELPEALLSTSTFPAILDPVISAEIPTDGAVLGPDEGSAVTRGVTCGTINCLATYYRGASGSTYGVRHALDGSVLDTQPIRLFDGAGVVAALGDRFVFAFIDPATNALRTRVLSSTLVTVNTTTIAGGTADTLALECGNNECLLVWRQSSGSQISATRLDDFGLPYDPGGFPLVPPATFSQIAVGFNGTNYLVAMGDNSTYAQRVQPDALVLDPSGFYVGFGSPSSVASNGSDFVVSSQSGPNGYLQRVSTSGTPVGSPLSQSSTYHPTLVWLGTSYLMVSQSTSSGANAQVLAADLTALGAPFSIGPMPNSGEIARPEALLSGEALLIGGYGDIVSMVSSTISASAPVVLNVGPNPQRRPSIATNGSEYRAVWVDRRNGSWGLYTARFGASGAALDPAATLVSPLSPDLTNTVGESAIAWNGSVYLATWWDYQLAQIRAIRISSAGVVLDAQPITVTAAASSPPSLDVASDGNNFLIVASASYVGASVVSGAGALLTPSPVNLAGCYAYPRVDRIGSTYMVLCGDRVYRLNSSGAVAGVPNLLPQSMLGDIACSPTSCLAVGDSVVSITASGVPSLVSGGVVSGTFVALIWDGAQYLAAAGSGQQLRSSYLSSTGAQIGVETVQPAPPTVGSVKLASTGSGSTLLVHQQQLTASPTYTSDRVAVRTVTDLLVLGQPCSAANNCTSGFCVDGVCCNSDCGSGVANDCQACSVVSGGSTNGTCTPRSSGAVCRTGVGACDADESCDGSSTSCPFDAVLPAGSQCRAAAGSCDLAESCNGIASTCPTDQVRPNGFTCRAAISGCDVAETCNGIGPACPGDVVQPGGTICRAPAGACDVAEACSGASNTCPADGVLAAGTGCRTAVGECDIAESCNGITPSCPADAAQSVGTPCGAAPNGDCDAPDSCSGLTGATAQCTDNVLSGNTCRAAVDLCDAPEICNGVVKTCPTDQLLASGSVCSPSIGSCDPAESCDGLTTTCPANVMLPDGTECEKTGACTAGDCIGGSEGGAGGSGGGALGGAGGSSGEGGAAGEGGGGAQSGGGDADGGRGGGSSADGGEGDDGCGCRLSSAPANHAAWSTAVLVAIALLRRRRPQPRVERL